MRKTAKRQRPRDEATADQLRLAIASHYAAWDALGRVCELTDQVAAQKQERVITEEDIELFNEVQAAEKEMWFKIIEAPCRTLADMQAKARFFLDSPRMTDRDMPIKEFRALMKSALPRRATGRS